MNKKIAAIDSTDHNSIFKLSDTLYNILYPTYKFNRQIIFLCVGTDRSTGDSLGPLVGEKLKFFSVDGISFLGNLENPVHAKNICKTIDTINLKYLNPFIIAIDACLGSIQNVGKIFIENKPLLPGSAMNKNLPPIGDLSITGIVNISGSLEFMVLQNTRLYTVMNLANIISSGIYHAVVKITHNKTANKVGNNL